MAKPVEERVKEIIVEQLGVEEDEVNPNAKFIGALTQAGALPPMHSGELRKALMDLAATDDVKQLVKDHERELMHLCALQRD